MSIIGVGIDLCDIGRIASSLEKPGFLRRVYTSAEREYIAGRGKLAASSAAGIFCVKEAVIKAAGTGIELTEIIILRVRRVFN